MGLDMDRCGPSVSNGVPSAMSDFKKLKVWRNSHALTLNVARAATLVRGRAVASLRDQMVRAAMSIPANIVEGTGQESGKEFCRFLSIALKSSSELEYHLILAHDLRAISRNDYESLTAQVVEVRKMLYGLRSRVLASSRTAQGKVSA
jgi:four helix bundle protein